MAMRSGEGSFLPHIEGLRGVAVLAVVLFHAGLPGVTGGFVGVDVFYVLSGFLITALLLRERERTGRISLPAFYARRARRILPAALVTIAVTLVAAALVLPPLLVPDVAADAAASALSVGNIRFALEATDYFAHGVPSPFLHYWSLGVEEQFYLVWPALLVLAARAGGRRPRLGATLALAAVFAGSLAFALWLTDASAPWAFYSLPSRAWQLALGGLLAAAGPLLTRVPPLALVPIGWAGVVGLGASFVVIDPATPYPGVAALLPTLASGALVVAAGGSGGLGALFGSRPLRFVGRISYSLYLVHWPLFVLPALALGGEELPLEARLGLVGLAVVVAAVSRVLVEEPFLGERVARLRPRLVLGPAVAVALAVAVGSIGLGEGALRAVDTVAAGSPVAIADGGDEEPAEPEPTDAAVEPDPAATEAPDPDASTDPGATARPGGSSDPGPAETASPRPTRTPEPTPVPTAPTGAVPLPANVQPRLSEARDDQEMLIRRGCSLGLRGSDPPFCELGDPNGQVTVALVGDSHAAQWSPALELLAKEHGWRFLPFTKASCVFVDMPVYSRELKRTYTECPEWRTRVVEKLVAEQPDLVVVSSARWFPVVNDADDDSARQGAAMARLLDRVPGRIAIIADTPRSEYDVPVCLSANASDVRQCATASAAAFTNRHLDRERAAVRALGSRASLVDLSDAICPYDACPAVLDGMIVYRDNHHLTATFARALAGDLDRRLPSPRP